MVGSEGGEGRVAVRDEGGSSGQGRMGEGAVGKEGWGREQWVRRDGAGSVCLPY